MSLADWSEAQLADFVRRAIDREVLQELPQLPARKSEAVEPKHDDLLIFKGDKWIPYTMPAARVWRSTDQTVSTFGATISFDTERFDTEVLAPGMWDPTVPTQLTCIQPGIYIVVGGVMWEDASDNLARDLLLQYGDVTGGITNVGHGPGTIPTVNGVQQQAVAIIRMQKNEYVRLRVSHSDFATHTISSVSDRSPILSMARIA